MRSAATFIAPALFLAPLACGCVHVEDLAPPEPEQEAAAAPSPPSVIRDVTVVYDGLEESFESPGPAPSEVARRPREPVLFSLGAGHGALGQVDLAPCREEGLSPGYWHLSVTFHHNGRVVRAAVASPTEPPSEALACIGERLEIAMVPVFDGDDITLSRSFFVN